MPDQETLGIEVKIGKLETKVDFVLQELKNLQLGTYSKIEMLIRDKADRKDLDVLQTKINEVQKHVNENVEKRVAALENRNSNYKLAFTLYSLAVGTMILLILYHIASPK